MPDGDFSRGADVHFRAGVQHQLKERFAEAIAEYEVALSLEPSHAPVLNNHGGALMKLAEQASGQELRRRHQKAAETSLRAATNFAPSTLDAYYNLGILLRGSHRLDEALTVYRAAAGLAPGSSTAREKLGGALLEQSSERHLGADRSYQRAAEAAESFGVAARLQPGDGALWERRADAFLAMGAVEDGRLPNDRVEERGVAAYKKALESLERVVALQPTQSGAYAKLAIAAHGVGLHRDPGVLGPLLLAMRYLQHAASDASRTVHLSGVEIADDHGGGGGTDKVCEHDATMATGVASCAPAASAQMERCEVHYSGMELPGQRVSAAHRGSGGEARRLGSERPTPSRLPRAQLEWIVRWAWRWGRGAVASLRHSQRPSLCTVYTGTTQLICTRLCCLSCWRYRGGAVLYTTLIEAAGSRQQAC
jgi:tetratricopeptide (TPR) repeat protein